VDRERGGRSEGEMAMAANVPAGVSGVALSTYTRGMVDAEWTRDVRPTGVAIEKGAREACPASLKEDVRVRCEMQRERAREVLLTAWWPGVARYILDFFVGKMLDHWRVA
jgi:hypothetical protein